MPNQAAPCALFGCIFLSCFMVYSVAELSIFGYFTFANPDLKQNHGAHCWVEVGNMFEPIPVGKPHSQNAIDGTAEILMVFKAQFFVSLATMILLLLLSCIGICLSFSFS